MRVVYLKTKIHHKFPRFRSKMKELGYGIQAVVYTDGEYAYKSCRFDTNYVKWLLDLRKKKLLDNPHVPKVYKIYVDKDKKDCLVQMEILSHGDHEEMWEESRVIQSKTENFQVGSNKKKRLTKLEKVTKQIADFISYQEGRGRLICLDMHGENVMLRNKKLVITDPVI